MKEIFTKAHSQVLEARNVKYLIESPEFEAIWKCSNLNQRDLLLGVGRLEVAKVRLWMTSIRNSNISLLGTKELKGLARTIRVENYSRLTRDELLERIWVYYERKHEN